MLAARAAPLSAAMWLFACHGGGGSTPGASASASAEAAPLVTGGPSSADAPRFALLLHGLGDRGASFARALDAPSLALGHALQIAAPDGAPDARGRRHWNAGPACCDFDGVGTDHVAALRAAMRGRPTVVVGFSNGSFMAHRLACAAPELAGVVSLAGGDPLHPEGCALHAPLPVVHVHGSADAVVPLGGGHVLGDPARASIPAAQETLLAWGRRNGCDVARGFTEQARLDLSSRLDGDETRVLRLGGCAAKVELWIMEGGQHLDPASPRVVDAALASVLSRGQ